MKQRLLGVELANHKNNIRVSNLSRMNNSNMMSPGGNQKAKKKGNNENAKEPRKESNEF